MLGQPMQVKVNDSTIIKLGPFNKDEAQMLIKDGGAGLHSVSRYTATNRALTFEDEEEWYEKTRTREDAWTWGIWDTNSKQPKLIGTSSLFALEEYPVRQATSGAMIVNKEYWGKGIASAIHKARTWYAFNQLNLIRIKSDVLLPNIGSRRALEKGGYFRHSIERNSVFVDGKMVHMEKLECLNPSKLAWSIWWHGDEPTPEAVQAREVTIATLKWADENVKLL